MKDTVIQPLNDLKENYTDKIANLAFKNLYDSTQVVIDDIYNNHPDIFLNHDNRFYQILGERLADDLNEAPLLYFSVWEHLIDSVLDETSRDLMYEYVIASDTNGDATNYINGFKNLKNNKPELALFYFNKIKFYEVGYFIGWCYMLLENFENSIKANELFLKKIESTAKEISNKNDLDLNQDNALYVIKWNIYNDLGYCYNKIEQYDRALTYYEKSLENFDLNESYEIYAKDEVVEGHADDFTIFVNNYLWSLEKNNLIDKCIEVLKFLLDKNLNDIYYKNRLNEFEKKKKNEFSNSVINNLFKPNRVAKIGDFERNKFISKEKNLEDMLLEQIKYRQSIFNKNLEVYNSDKIYGRQYFIAEVNGFLDLLLIDKKTDIAYVVELKRKEAGIEVITQIEKYILGLKHEIDNEIRGIICVHEPKDELVDLVKQKDNIELFTYRFDFDKLA